MSGDFPNNNDCVDWSALYYLFICLKHSGWCKIYRHIINILYWFVYISFRSFGPNWRWLWSFGLIEWEPPSVYEMFFHKVLNNKMLNVCGATIWYVVQLKLYVVQWSWYLLFQCQFVICLPSSKKKCCKSARPDLQVSVAVCRIWQLLPRF